MNMGELENMNLFGANVQYKDSVFRDLFQIPKYATELCRTLLKSDSITTNDVVVSTLTDVLFDKIKNDVSYDINDRNIIVMLEHQSTLNYNMPLRMLIYKKERIKINMPLFYVMYNGEEDIEPISTMKLSEAFDCAIHDKTIEMIVTVFNLNKLDQIQMLCDCATLAGYSTFVTLVRNYRKS